MAVPVGLGSFSGLTSVFDAANQDKRDFPMPMVGGRREEMTTVTFPETIKIAALPKPVTLDTPFGHYESSYKMDGSTLTVMRALEMRLDGPTVAAEDYPVWRAMGMAIARDVKAQILYQ
ncbi:MAG TPA: hypothetical protein VN809_03595 [Telmatospirillum sp.]|nr:hypothetical protein [Telmatospirillum sp.]